MTNKKLMNGIDASDVQTAYLRILYWFFAVPNQDFTFNEICKTTKTSKTSAQVVIAELLKRGLIQKTVLGKLWRLKANEESSTFRGIKIAYNLSQIYESGVVNMVRGKYPLAHAIVLFGSHRKGDDISGSDLDIAVEVTGLKQMTIIEIGSLDSLGWRTNVPVRAHLFSRDTVDLNVFTNIANGILLDGFLEVYPTCE